MENKNFPISELYLIASSKSSGQKINFKGKEHTVIDLENDKEITYKIVGNLESDPDNGHISIDTPIAKGLVGKFIDDEINIQTPSGNLNFEILEVKHI